MAVALTAALTVFADHGAMAKNRAVPCGQVSDATLFPLMAERYQTFTQKWLAIGDDWFSSYTLKLEDKNPLLPGRTPAKTVTGYVWLRKVTCQATLDRKTGIWTMSIDGRDIKFNEEDGGWVEAVKKGALASYRFARQGDQWTTEDLTREVSVLGGDDAEKRPEAAELPPRTNQKTKKKSK